MPVYANDRFQKFFVKALFAQGDDGVVSSKDELEKELVPIQINSTPSHIPPEDRNILLPAVGYIHFLVHVLVIPDTDVGCCRGDQGEGFLP